MTELFIALVTLTVLEIVLGVDNVIFISILSGKLPKELRARPGVWAGSPRGDARRPAVCHRLYGAVDATLLLDGAGDLGLIYPIVGACSSLPG